MRQIQCNFGGIDDLCKLCQKYLNRTDMQIMHFILDKIWNFWHIARLSTISCCKVTWSQKQCGFFLAHPVYMLYWARRYTL